MTSGARMGAALAAMEKKRETVHAIAARYDVASGRLDIDLHTGVELTVPVASVQGLAGAGPAELAEIEITPLGLGLH